MLGSTIGAGVGAAASIFGGISASKAIKKMKANLEEQRKKPTLRRRKKLIKTGMTDAITKMQHSVQMRSVFSPRRRKHFATETVRHRVLLP